MVFVEVLIVYAKRVNDAKEITVALPHEMMKFCGVENENNEVIVYVSKRRVVACKPNQIREALIRGYVEMGQINLSISSECLHAEYEAEHTVERLVSGG
ncbi:transcriptional regulator [Ureibacillus suwonensis]|jgi:CopG family transcriptional regulator/antitoxin EndoAI|uniref:Transcriptional regulator n=1 Tax=Ureibacillus suwonensis TaxID=313007 RepID=A0ABW0RFA6_9BACL